MTIHTRFGAPALTLLALAVIGQTSAQAQDIIDVPSQPLTQALAELGAETGLAVSAATDLVAGKRSQAVSGAMSPIEALQILLTGTGLKVKSLGENTAVLVASQNVVPSASDTASDEFIGEEIVVEAVLPGTLTETYAAPDSFSATRTDRPLIKTPQSVQAVTRQALEDSGATDVRDAYDFLAGISPDNNTGGLFGDQYIARGFLVDNLLINGNRTGRPVTLDSANVERIEALRGPTGTLFGRADPGGLVNVITKQPLFDDFYEVSLTGTSGFFDDGSRQRKGRFTFDSGGPLTEDKDLRYRLNIAAEYDQSFRQDVDSNLFLISPVIDFDIGENTIVNAEFTYQRREEPFDRGVFFVNGGLPLDRDFNLGEGNTGSGESDYLNGTIRIDHRFSENVRARLGLYGNFNDIGNEGSQVAGVAGNFAILQNRLVEVRDLFLTAQPELVIDFDTGPVSHSLLLGADFEYQTRDTDLLFGASSAPVDVFNATFPVAAPPADISIFGAANFVNEFTARSLGFYIQDEIDVTDQLSLVAGLRFDAVWLDKTTEVVNNVQATDAAGEQVEAETGKSYEIGAKFNLNDRVIGTLSLFRTDKENVLESDPLDPIGIAQINLGDVRSQGVELDLSGELIENLSFGLTYTYTDVFTSSSAGALPRGTRPRNVPEHAASLQAAYSFERGALDGLRVFGAVVYEGARGVNTAVDTPELPSYTRFDLGASYQINDDVDVNFLVRNVADTTYYTSAAGPNNVDVGEPFNASLGVKFQF
ncbi:MAG: TonB-dependent receptor [Pseudomonadota bacterium]